MEIRPYEDRDAEAVIALWQRADLVRPQNPPDRDVARKSAHSGDLFFVGSDGERLVGTVMAGYDGHRGWLNYVAVDPAERRRGYARQLLRHAEDALRAKGCVKVNLQVRSDNDDALAFYDREGYVRDDVVSFGKRLVDESLE